MFKKTPIKQGVMDFFSRVGGASIANDTNGTMTSTSASGGSSMGNPGVNKPANTSDADPAAFKGDGNGQVVDTNAEGKDKSPLDSFSDLWDTKKVEGAQDTTVDFNKPYYTVDDKTLGAHLKTIDIAKSIPPDLIKAALSGDQDAFRAVINGAIQASLGHSVNMSTRIAENGVRQLQERFDRDLPSRFRNLSARQNQVTSPVLQHKAVQPMVELLKEKILANPANKNLSGDEINGMVTQYFESISEAVIASKQGQNNQVDSSQDFSRFFDEQSN